MKSEEEGDVGSGLAGPPATRIAVGGDAMPAVHRFQDTVRSALDRQVQERHQRGQVAMRVEQVLSHVVGMAGRVADALEPRNGGEPAAQQRRGSPSAPSAVGAVDSR